MMYTMVDCPPNERYEGGLVLSAAVTALSANAWDDMASELILSRSSMLARNWLYSESSGGAVCFVAALTPMFDFT